MWPRAGLPMLSTKKARSRASKPAVCGQSARPVLSEYAARPQKVRPAVGMDALRPDSARCGVRTRRSRWRAAVRIRAAQAGPTRHGPNGRVSSRIGAPWPSPIRRSPDGSPAARIDAPLPNPRAKAGRGAPRFGLPCRRPPWRSAVWMDAAQRGQKAGSVPLSPSPCRTFVLRRPARPRAAAFPRSERSALPCTRPRRFASTQAAVSDGAGHKRSFYKQAHRRPNRLCCLCLLSISPNLQREGPAAQPPQSFRAKSRKERQP